MTRQPDISIVIVSWNTRDLLARCLQSVRDDVQTARPESNEGFERPALRAVKGWNVETFVVDNASTDGSAAMAKERFPWVHIVENQENVGFARANDQAIARSTGRFVLMLNSDTVVHPGALATLIEFMDAHPQAGAAGAHLLNGDGTLQPSCQPMLTPGREFWRLSFLERLWPHATYRLDRWDTTTPRQVDVIKGACVLLRRAALDQVGLLDERYFMYTEEVDLCFRLALAGWECWYVPAAIVTHFGEASSRQIPGPMYRQLYHSKFQFFRKFGGERRVLVAKLLFGAVYVPRALVASAFGVVRPSWRVRGMIYRRLLVELLLF